VTMIYDDILGKKCRKFVFSRRFSTPVDGFLHLIVFYYCMLTPSLYFLIPPSVNFSCIIAPRYTPSSPQHRPANLQCSSSRCRWQYWRRSQCFEQKTDQSRPERLLCTCRGHRKKMLHGPRPHIGVPRVQSPQYEPISTVKSWR